MSTQLVNLTPHAVKIFGDDDSVIAEFESAGVARATQTNIPDGDIGGVPIVQTKFGEVIDLPEPQPDTMYIVSIITLQAARAAGRNMDDLLIVTDMVRDDQGRILGARALARA